MPQLLGVAEGHIEVLAVHQGQLAPIPFQVDEVLPDGRYALSEGPEPLADDSPRILDRDDEVAMMLSDCGDRAGAQQKPPPDALEIEVPDPQGGARRYAYIAAVPSPRLSPVSYVRYDPGEGRIDGASYEMTFRGDFPVGLALKDDNGKPSPSLINGSEVQVTARLLMFFKIKLNGTGLTNRVLAWRAGPIRVIRRVSHSVKLILGIQAPPVVSDEIFYRDYAEDSFAARVLWMPRVFFDDVRLRAWLDFVGVREFTLSWSSMSGPPLHLDEAADAQIAEIERDPPHTRWLAIRGDGKIVIQTFMASPDLAIVSPRVYLCDAKLDPAPAENCTSETLQIGYLMTGWENLSAGEHRLKSLLLVVPDTVNPEKLAAHLATTPVVRVAPARPGTS